jgi:hypothetical protein
MVHQTTPRLGPEGSAGDGGFFTPALQIRHDLSEAP